MNNKYQEALDEFVGYIIDNTELFDNVAINEYLSKRINTLQELVDITNEPIRIYGDMTTKVLSFEEYSKMTKEQYREWLFKDE